MHPVAVARGAFVEGKISEMMLPLIGLAWDFIKRSGVKSDGINVAILPYGTNRIS